MWYAMVKKKNSDQNNNETGKRKENNRPKDVTSNQKQDKKHNKKTERLKMPFWEWGPKTEGDNIQRACSQNTPTHTHTRTHVHTERAGRHVLGSDIVAVCTIDTPFGGRACVVLLSCCSILIRCFRTSSSLSFTLAASTSNSVAEGRQAGGG